MSLIGRVLMVVLGLSGISHLGYAQEPGSTIELEQVVVSATKIETPAESIGQSVTVITREEMERRHLRDAAEALRAVPGLIVSQTGSRGNVTSVFIRGGENDHVLVLIDGVQINPAGGAVDFSQISTENIDRIEILRGPQSALYGTEAVTGVIQIFTRKGVGPLQATLSSAFGQHNEHERGIYEHHFGLAGPGFSLGYARSDDGGILALNNRFYRNSFSGRWDAQPADQLALGLSVRIEDKQSRFPTEGAGDRFDPPDPRQYLDEDHLVVGAELRHQLREGWVQQARLGLADQDRVIFDAPDSGRVCSFGACDGIVTTFFETNEQRLTAEYLWRLDHPIHEKVSAQSTIGFEYEQEELLQTSTSDFGFGPDVSHENRSRINRAYFLQEEVSLGERFFITGGARIDDNTLFGTEVNPKGSMAVLIRELGLKLRASIGTGIKAPTFTEQFGTTFSAGNPDLRPEKSFGWDAGFDLTIPHGSLGVAYFANEFEDLIAFINAVAPTPAWENIQAAKSSGVETQLRMQPLDNLQIRGGVSWLWTRVTDDGGLGNAILSQGGSLIKRPRMRADWGAAYQWKLVTAGLDGFYVGRRDDVEFSTFTRVEDPGYVVWNARLSVKVPRHPEDTVEWEFFGRALNLFNRQYEEVSGFSSPRFSYLVGLNMAF